MTMRIVDLPPAIGTGKPRESGVGAITTEHGNLPLRELVIDSQIIGLASSNRVEQTFHNPHADAIEATYIFPLPDRAAVTGMTMKLADRNIVATLKTRGEARQEYDQAIQAGQQGSIAEEDRPDVFTMRVGNIPSGEQVTVVLDFAGPLTYEDNEATFQLPLVVAPRYIPGEPLEGTPSGDGYAQDTDAVPDASRITPPVLLPGFPNPVKLGITVTIDPNGFPLSEVKSSLHAVVVEETTTGATRLRIEPGERVNRDFILRFGYAAGTAIRDSLVTIPDAPGSDSGVFAFTAIPPAGGANPQPKDVVVLLDRSGSMKGWKEVAARRAAARIIDSLHVADRFAVRVFDTTFEGPETLGNGLSVATDRNRYQAVEYLSSAYARGGTDILSPIREAGRLLGEDARDRIIVLVTDGQAGNEDQILSYISENMSDIRIHSLGIDRAVNVGFLRRVALMSRGRCELVESEDRLDEASANIHRRIVAPVISNCVLELSGATIVKDSLAPRRLPDMFTGVPFIVRGRYESSDGPIRATLSGTDTDGTHWNTTSMSVSTTEPVQALMWARAHIRDLEDMFVSHTSTILNLEDKIVGLSLEWNILCRFTAFVAIDERVVVEGGQPRKIIQPVELPSGWAEQQNTPFASSPGYGSLPAPGGPPTAAAPMFGAPAPAAAPPVPGGPVPRGASNMAMPLFRKVVPPVNRQTSTPLLPQLRDDLKQELDMLTARDNAASDRDIRMALSDLASRLSVVIKQLGLLGDLSGPLINQLRVIVDELETCEGPTPPRGEELLKMKSRATATLSSVVAKLHELDKQETKEKPGKLEPRASQNKTEHGDHIDTKAFWRRKPKK